VTHSLWWLLVDALAVYRLTHLIVDDTITAPFRAWTLEHWPGWPLTLVTCSWCISIWIGGCAVALTALAPGVWQYPAYGLALSGVAGFLQER
jgi:Protein of unknown function (DUF1360)